MKYAILIHPTARRELADLPLDIFRQIDARILALADHPRPPGSKKLKSSDHLHRIHSGDHRIIYEIQDRRLVVVILRIGHRRDVYRRL